MNFWIDGKIEYGAEYFTFTSNKRHIYLLIKISESNRYSIKCVCISFNLRFQWKPPPVVKDHVFLSRPIIISLSFLGCVPFSNTRNISAIKLARKA